MPPQTLLTSAQIFLPCVISRSLAATLLTSRQSHLLVRVRWNSTLPYLASVSWRVQLLWHECVDLHALQCHPSDRPTDFADFPPILGSVEYFWAICIPVVVGVTTLLCDLLSFLGQVRIVEASAQRLGLFHVALSYRQAQGSSLEANEGMQSCFTLPAALLNRHDE